MGKVYTYTYTFFNKVAVIGSGAYGCVLANQIANNSNKVTIWSHSDKDAFKIEYSHVCPILDKPINNTISATTSLEEAVKDADYIVITTASNYVRSTCKELAKYIKNQDVIIASKGMEGDKVLSQVAGEELGRTVYVFSGPSHAEQIIEGEDTYVDYYGPEKFKAVIESDSFKLRDCDDPVGMQVGGALKNILAIGVGLLEGSGVKSNTISAYKTEGWKEVVKIGEALGASRSTFYGLSGLGDFYTTADSTDSRNKRCGLKLAEGKSIDQIKEEMKPATIEGLNAIESARQVIERYNLDCPVISGLDKLLSPKSEEKISVIGRSDELRKSLRMVK